MYVACLLFAWFGGNLIIAGDNAVGPVDGIHKLYKRDPDIAMMIGMIFVMFVLSRASLTRISEVLEEKN